MFRMNEEAKMVPVKMTKQERARIAKFNLSVSPQEAKGVEDYFSTRIPTLNSVSGQLLGHVPLDWTPAVRASEVDWSGTPLDPIFTHTGDESVAATLLGILIKDWFLRNASAEWYITDTTHWWRNIEVNTYLRLPKTSVYARRDGANVADLVTDLKTKWCRQKANERC